ncbi:MAG: M23 family metallopeptidase [Steroidobacteraceae bacterium]|nr:M23 family metallopeptidase [Steroidobacteraceae bacterium]
MAFVIVSAGHLTHSRLRTLPARPVLVAAVAGVVLLMATCGAAGYRLARLATPVAEAPGASLGQPEIRALVSRVGNLAGRLVQLEQDTATLARRLGATPMTAVLSSNARSGPRGGPMIPADGIARLEGDVLRLERTLDRLSDAAIERELESMAYPNRMPVAGSRLPVSSPYGTRHDPFTGRLARHSGLDIPARHGTPILASGGGRVVVAGYQGAYGRTVVIDHGDGLATLYGHASTLLVRPGDVVLPQQKIALVGSTGRSTGAHLHFEVIRDGNRVEPQQYLARVLDQRAVATAQ